MITHNLYQKKTQTKQTHKQMLKQLNTHYISFRGSGGGLDTSLGSLPGLSSTLPYPIGWALQNWSLLGWAQSQMGRNRKIHFESMEHLGRWFSQAKGEALLDSP